MSWGAAIMSRARCGRIGRPYVCAWEQYEACYQAAKKTEEDSDGGSWPVYPSRKSWDEVSVKTSSSEELYYHIFTADRMDV